MKKKTILSISAVILILAVGLIITSRMIYNNRFKANYKIHADRKEAWIRDLNHFQNNYYKVCKSFPVDSIDKSNQLIDSIKEHYHQLETSVNHNFAASLSVIS
jgi:hypothetical protein